MHRIRPGAPRSVNQLVNPQIRLGRRCWPNAKSGVGQSDVHGPGVGLGIHGHRADSHFTTRADDAHGDLAAVGDEQLVDHAGHIRNTP